MFTKAASAGCHISPNDLRMMQMEDSDSLGGVSAGPGVRMYTATTPQPAGYEEEMQRQMRNCKQQ